jgi:D-alanyl-D-alanine carboxypeptidase
MTMTTSSLSAFRRLVRGMWIGLTLLTCSGTALADRIDDIVTAQMKRQNIPGVAIAVLKAGRPVKIKGYGYANLETGTRVTPETIFEIGSVSKQFIASGIMLLVRDGKLGLDDPVRKFIPEAPESWQPITLRHLLTHTSGLVREAPGQLNPVPETLAAVQAGFTPPLVFAPGSKQQYSNLGYFTLAEVITRVAQQPWRLFIQSRIFAPLGMTATRTTSYEEVVPQRANGYVLADGRPQNAQRIQGVRPSGAFLSTIQDLAKWETGLNGEAVLTAAERALMWTAVRLNDGSTKDYGFGWEVNKVGTHRQIRHGGSMPGFRSDFSRYPDEGVTVITLGNTGSALVERVSDGIAALQIEGLLPRRKAMRLSDNALDAYAGMYKLPTSTLTVTRRDDQLVLTLLAGARSSEVALLTAESRTRFYDADNPRLTYTFESDAGGKMHIVQRSEEGRETLRGAKLD